MHKKDDELIAKALKGAKLPTVELRVLDQWNSCVCCIGNILVEDNPRFDAEKFMKACGYDN